MTPAYTRRDADLLRTKALPSAASSSVSTTPIDLRRTSNGQQITPCEIEIVIPALNATMLPDTKTATYVLEHSAALSSGALSSPTTLQAIAVQTGAGGAGADGTTVKLKLPSDAERYIGLKCTLGAGTADASAVSMTLDILF